MNNDLYRVLAEASKQQTPIWLATVIAAEGSTPVDAGMKMAVRPDGTSVGTIGGGELERRVIARVIGERPVVIQRWRYDLGRGTPEAEITGMVCGGFQEILVEPLFSGTPLTIVGGGHCGAALSALAGATGFAVTVLDDREEWVSPLKHPSALRLIKTSFLDVTPHIAFSSDLFIVIMTHGHKHDEAVLRQTLRQEHRYLGMLGSEEKVRDVQARLQRDGFTDSELRTVYAPAGFSIGSHTPEEIAVSILAQMLAVKNGKQAHNGNPLIHS